MFVVMQPASSRADVERVMAALPAMNAVGRITAADDRCVIEILEATHVDRRQLVDLPAVDCVLDRAADVPAAVQPDHPQTTPVPLGPRAMIGDTRLAIIAGPCSVENEDRLYRTAEAVAAAGAVGLRGGAFKPRTSPYAFQGLGEAALELLARARDRTGLALVTEVMSAEQVTQVAAVADLLQVGSRNMHNSALLRAVGRAGKPVLLKRGWSATLEEFLLAAEYLRQAGCPHVVLCERGIRTFEDYARNTLALAIVPEVKRRSDLPILVDPSHGTGRAHLVAPLSRAAIACGADGLLIEVHPDPPRAWSDGDQSLDLPAFGALMASLPPLVEACGRKL
jgi:3-deoxy-7-phosphoheptulonate synthase